MDIKTILIDKEKKILKKWEEVVMGRYDPQAVSIFKKQKDQFANPLGYKTTTGLKELYEVICDESDQEIETPALGQFVKLMAVQEVNPSEALKFVFTIKRIVRKAAGKKKISDQEWEAFDNRVDGVALALFDIYSASREQLWEVRYEDFEKKRFTLTREGGVCPSALLNDE